MESQIEHIEKLKAKLGPSEVAEIESSSTVIELFRKRYAKKLVGKGIMNDPVEMGMVLDFTGLRGSAIGIYYGLVFQLPKWAYTVKKVDEWMEVTPEYEYYRMTIAQKQQLEQSIKTGLTSAAQAVADYELLGHDFRRYREMVDYFKKAREDEHVLRSLFVDRVDSFTGEGYSMITMTRRWPTIITDFIRMKEEWYDKNQIRRELDVSDAEATVLKTKNQLFRQWKDQFFPEVKARLARIETMMKARKKSVDEYKRWLKPYIARYRMMKEPTEDRPAEFSTNPVMTPGFGQSQAFTFAKLWTWKPFSVAEKGKPVMGAKRPGQKWQGEVHPYDDLIKEWKERIEVKYGIRITEKDVDSILSKAVSAGEMDPRYLYYVLFDINISMTFLKSPPPQGSETDNVMFSPLQTWVISQNIMLLHVIEIYAKEKAFEKYVNEIVGAPEMEEESLMRIEEEFKERPVPKESIFSSLSPIGDAFSGAGRLLRRFGSIFVRPGPYESNLKERVTKMYSRSTGPAYGQISGHIKKLMEVE